MDNYCFYTECISIYIFRNRIDASVLASMGRRFISKRSLLAIIVLISVMLFVIRFISISLFMYSKMAVKVQKQLNEILILTFGGVKGTVSLATIFILPFSINNMMFYQRSLLLFLTAGVILVTLVIGIIVLPMLTETEEAKSTV